VRTIHTSYRRASLATLAILCVLAAPGRIVSQEQFFVDETAERLPSYEDESIDADFGDVNADGILDLIISNTVMGIPDISNLLLINLGEGFFGDSSEAKWPIIALEANHSTLLDIEGDHDYDIYVSNALDRDYLFVNDGAGNFSDGSGRIPLDDDSRSTNAVYGDVDADMDVDFVISEFNWQFNYLFINNGTGRFTRIPPSGFPSGQDSSPDAAFGDVDGDFDLDVLFANDGARTVLLLGGAGRSFTNETELRMPDINQVSTSASFADIDNDGDLDIFVTNGFLDSMNRLLINNGSGFFVDESALRIPTISDISLGHAFGDIDNDNDLDIIVANDAYQGAGYTNRVLVNNGSGYYSDETQLRLPDSSLASNHAVLGDIDNDYDLDLIIVNSGDYPYGEQNRIFINNSTPDSFPPTIPRTYHHPDTGDTTNPYLITTTVWDNISIVIGELEVSLFFRALSDTSGGTTRREFMEIPMLDCGGFLYRERIPAQSSIGTVEYYIKAEDRTGNISYDPPNAPDSVFSFLVDVNVGIGDDPPSMPSLPKVFSLSQNYPNPFNPSTTIQYNIPESACNGVDVKIEIYNLRGQLVRDLLDEKKSCGSYSIQWDGKSDAGGSVSSGLYLYRIRAGDFVERRRMVISK